MRQIIVSQRCVFVLLGTLLCWLAGCSDRKGSSGETDGPAAFVTLTSAPVSTFRQSCRICHTPQTQWFGSMVPQRKRSLLRPKVKTMMETEAFLEPTEKEIEAMMAYCRALAADEPFLCVTSIDSGPDTSASPAHIQGEATPYATVRIGPEETRANGIGFWEFTACTLPEDRIIEATHNDKTTRLSLLTVQWSHDR